jgi:hypothetical protein
VTPWLIDLYELELAAFFNGIPMTDLPYADPQGSFHRKPVSAAAIVSFVTGLLLCVPLLTGVAALGFAVAAFKATRTNARRGRGLAIAGLILGLFNLLIWIGVGSVILTLMAGSAAPRAAMRRFTADVAANNLPAAMTECDPAMPPADVEKFIAYVKPFGTYSDLSVRSVDLFAGTTHYECHLAGTMHFATGDHAFAATVVKDGATWKVYNFRVL